MQMNSGPGLRRRFVIATGPLVDNPIPDNTHRRIRPLWSEDTGPRDVGLARGHDQSFPQELLYQPSSARLAYFRALTIGHPLLLQVYDDLRLAIRDSAPG
jgi:hypothetical protein